MTAVYSLRERLVCPLLDHIDAGALAARLDQQPRGVWPRHSMKWPCARKVHLVMTLRGCFVQAQDVIS